MYALIQMELDISNLARAVGDFCTAEHFFEASLVRKKTINSIFWNSEKGQWLDYWLDNGSYKVYTYTILKVTQLLSVFCWKLC